MNRAAPLLLILAAAAGLSACATKDGPPLSGPQANAATPLSQWDSQVGVVDQAQSIALAQHPGGLSQAQIGALSSFVDRWLAAGGGPVSVRFPSGGASVPAVASQAADFLRGEGVAQVDLAAVDRGAIGDPVTVQYQAAVATVPLCGQRIGNYMSNNANGVDANFGCAVTANLAAQAADPRDLQHPRAADPLNAARPADVIGKYQTGADTSSAAPAGFGAASSSSSSKSGS